MDVVQYLRKNGIGIVILFGASKGGEEIYTKLIADCIDVSYFCDNDSTKWGKFFLGKRIVSPSELNINDFILISSSFQDEIYCQLRDAGFKNVFNFPTGDIITKEHYQDEIIYQNEKLIKELYAKLADAQSKKVLENIISYRLTNDLYYIKEIASYSDQYFPKIINLCDNEIFVDVGAFDGDTLKIFLKKTRKHKSIIAIAFEPDKDSYKKLNEIHGGYWQEIEFYNNAVSDSNTTIYFNGGKGIQSHVSPFLTDTLIEAITLDSFFQNKDKPTYVKMDVEGSESAIIKGAKKIISENLPKLAISVYHRSDDLWVIPRLINSITPNYEFYLRHHGHNICETVLYCLPSCRLKV